MRLLLLSSCRVQRAVHALGSCRDSGQLSALHVSRGQRGRAARPARTIPQRDLVRAHVHSATRSAIERREHGTHTESRREKCSFPHALNRSCLRSLLCFQRQDRGRHCRRHYSRCSCQAIGREGRYAICVRCCLLSCSAVFFSLVARSRLIARFFFPTLRTLFAPPLRRDRQGRSSFVPGILCASMRVVHLGLALTCSRDRESAGAANLPRFSRSTKLWTSFLCEPPQRILCHFHSMYVINVSFNFVHTRHALMLFVLVRR